MKSKIRNLIIGIALSALAIFILIQVASLSIPEKSGFNRVFRNKIIKTYATLNLGSYDYYLSGNTSSNLFLARYSAPIDLLQTTENLTDTVHFRLSDPPQQPINWERIRLTVDSPAIYMLEGISPSFLLGQFPGGIINPLKLDTIQFTDAVPVSATTLIVKKHDVALQQDILVKYNCESGQIHSRFILQKQLDGRFCVDGMLLYDRSLSKIIYVYYYRNEYILLDSNLNKLAAGRTIDTTKLAKFEVEKLNNGQKLTLGSPPHFINRKSCAADSLLFVQSPVRADNDDRKLFAKNCVIDVYNINKDQYLFSFYLLKPTGEKLNQIRFSGQTLYALFGKYLFAYKLQI